MYGDYTHSKQIIDLKKFEGENCLVTLQNC